MRSKFQNKKINQLLMKIDNLLKIKLMKLSLLVMILINYNNNMNKLIKNFKMQKKLMIHKIKIFKIKIFYLQKHYYLLIIYMIQQN